MSEVIGKSNFLAIIEIGRDADFMIIIRRYEDG